MLKTLALSGLFWIGILAAVGSAQASEWLDAAVLQQIGALLPQMTQVAQAPEKGKKAAPADEKPAPWEEFKVTRLIRDGEIKTPPGMEYLEPIKLQLLGFGDEPALDETRRKELEKLRKNELQQIDRDAYISPKYPVDKTPKKISLPKGVHAVMAVYVLYEGEAKQKIGSLKEIGSTFSPNVDKSKKGPVRFVALVFPLDDEGYKAIVADGFGKRIETSPN